MDKKKKIKLLESARKLIVKGWTQGTYARNEDDEIVNNGSPAACKWCLTGALDFACTGDDKDIINGALMSFGLWKDLQFTLILEGDVEHTYDTPDGELAVDLVAWNDSDYRMHHQVINLLTRTIERLKNGTVEKRHKTEENQAASRGQGAVGEWLV